MINYPQICTKLLLVFLFLFSFYIMFYNLGKPTLENWDEAWYGEITKQMFKSHEFIVPRWNNETFLEKPPMYMWLSAFFSFLFGLNEFSIRLTSALSGFIITIIVLLYSYKKWGIISSFLAFSSIILNNIFVWRARSGNIDSLVSLLIFVSYFLTVSNKKYRYVLLGMLFAIIYLTKTSLVIFPLSIFVLHEIFYKRKEIKKNIKEYFKLLIVFITLAGFWLFLGFIKVGKDFLIAYLLQSDQGAAIINVLKFKTDYVQHMYYSLQRRYFYVFIVGLFFLIRELKESKNFLILIFSILLLLFLSFSEKNNNWYLIPSMPFWSLAIAFGTYKSIQLLNNSKFILLTVFAIAAFVSYKTYTINIYPILNTYSTNNQAESSRKINTLAREHDTIVRLDHLYPTTIYYSDRRVLSSPVDSGTRAQFISRKDLVKEIEKGKIKWLVGTIIDVEKFIKENHNLSLKEISVNKTESIIQVL